MEYTKGERQLYCGDEYWLVEIKDKPNRPNILIGKFRTKEDALLDSAAPEMYEALKRLRLETNLLDNEKCDHDVGICWCAYKNARFAADQALAKAGGKVK